MFSKRSRRRINGKTETANSDAPALDKVRRREDVLGAKNPIDARLRFNRLKGFKQMARKVEFNKTGGAEVLELVENSLRRNREPVRSGYG
jgi:hypothetical protein